MWERNNLITILQAFTILWVVVGHAPLDGTSISGIWYVEYSYIFSHIFCMPMFFLISGYLFRFTRKGWPYKKMILDKLKRLGIPFLFFTTIAFLLKAAFPDGMQRPVNFCLADYIKCFFYPGDGALAEMWFIAVLMICFLITPLLNRVLSRKALSYFAIVFLLAFHFINIDVRLFCLGDFLHYVVFYYCGMILYDSRILKTVVSNNHLNIYCSVTAAFVMIIGFLLEFEFFKTIGVLVIIFFFCSLLDRKIPDIFFSFRAFSYQIFLMGIFPQIAVKLLYQSGVCSSYFAMFVCCIAFGIYIPVLISLLVNKTGSVYLKLLIGLK